MKNHSYRAQVIELAASQYHTSPEQLWPKYPGNEVLRHTNNNKWYGIIMDVSQDKLGLEGESVVDILDVKLDPIMIGSLLQKEGFFPAYHMNKENWITILLDGTVPLDTIKMLLDISFELTNKPPKKGKK